jgi:hypothetical protein
MLGISLGWTGCDLFPVSCTDIGCSNGFTIEVKTAETGDRDIDVVVEIGDESLACAGAFDAVNGLSCDGGVFLFPTEDGFTIEGPADAEGDAHLIVDGDETDVDLAWESFAPNGEACGPECLRGTGEATVP